MRWLDDITDSMDMRLSKLQKTVKEKEACHAAVHGVTELDNTWQLKNDNSKASVGKQTSVMTQQGSKGASPQGLLTLG